MNVQAHAHSVFIDGFCENSSNETVQLNRILSIIHIGVEAGAITNENIREVNDIFYMAMGVIGIKNLGNGVAHFARNLPNNVKTLIKENKNIKKLILSKYLEYRIAITKLKNSDEWVDISAEVRQQVIRQEKSFITLADAKNIPNDSWGVSKEVFINGKTSEDILTIAKGSRPAPETYLKADYIQQHLAKFEEGIVRFTSRQAFETYGTLVPDGGFVLPKKYLDDILSEAKGNLQVIEKKLGLESGYLNNDDLMIVFIEKQDYRNIRIPSGNEGGTNPLWISGGIISGGIPEAVMDFSHKPNFQEIKLK
jgi:hypothetical protein